MTRTDNLIEHGRQLYENHAASSHMALMMATRYYVSAQIGQNQNLIHTAYHTVQSVIDKNPSNVYLVLMLALLNIELGHYDKADEELASINGYKNHFKINEPIAYGALLYLQSLNEYRTNKTRAAYRYFKTLDDFATDDPRQNAMFCLLLGMLKVEFGELEAAGAYLEECYIKGIRSPFLFLTLNRYFGHLFHSIPYADVLLIPFLNWGLAHDLDLSKIVAMYADKIVLSFMENSEIGIKLYKTYPNEGLLREICKSLINDYDYSERAYYFYMEAMTKQIELNGLNDYIVKSSFRNNKEKLNVYNLKQFLKTGEIALDIKPYLYHMLLSHEKYSDLVEEHHHSILQFGIYSLEQSKRGHYYNSIYKYIVDNEGSVDIAEKYILIAEEKLFADLLSYEIDVSSPHVQYVWVNEKEKSEMARYEVVDHKTTVKASTDSFQYYCFSEAQKTIVSCDTKITKLIKNEDIHFCIRYYNKQYQSDDLLIVLAKYYINQEEPPKECIHLLQKAMEVTNLSKSFKMKIIATIGNIYYNADETKKAVDYYRLVDEKHLNDRYIDHMAQILAEENETDKVVHILLNRPECLFDKTMFYIVKQLAREEKYHSLIADASYELLLKSWYDRQLIDIVLANYKGSQEEWQQLDAVLNSIGIKEKKLDELIIQNGIWMHKFDVGIQDVFKSMVEGDEDNELVGAFVDFCVYEVLMNKARLQFDTVVILEKIFLETKDKNLAYMLGHVYIEQGLNTLHSAQIIQCACAAMEKDDILFTIFKESKDKSYSTPYIEKNHPFVYKSVPNKDVVLYFKADDEKEYSSKKMKYMMFGLYMAVLPHFYNEEIEYYISEEMTSGSIDTRKKQIYNNTIYLYEEGEDPYFAINNAIIYDKMFKYERVDQIIAEKIKESKQIRGTIF